MIELVGTSDLIAKFEKSDIFARMRMTRITQNLGVGENEIIILGLYWKAKLYIFGVIRKVLEGLTAWC